MHEYERVTQARNAVRAVREQYQRARYQTFATEPEVLLLAAHLADYEHGHAWTVMPEEASNAAAVRSMHIEAHRLLIVDYMQELECIAAEERGVPYADAPDAELTSHLPDPFTADYTDFLYRQLTTCGHQAMTGPAHAAVPVLCDHGIGHYPHTPHAAPDPFGGRRLAWGDGSQVAGEWR